jgi:hypothetical protein
VVGPTKVQPRFFRSLERRVEVGVVGLAAAGAIDHLGPLVVARLMLQKYGQACRTPVCSLNGAPGIVDGRDDLAAMADDAGLSPSSARYRIVEQRHLVEIEAGKGGAEIVALAQDRQPGEAGLETFEADLLEQPAISSCDGIAPFLVVIAQIIRQVAVPVTTRLPSSPVVMPVSLICSASFLRCESGFTICKPCFQTER